jgi:transcriptional regulator with XRE-family HTH domain
MISLAAKKLRRYRKSRNPRISLQDFGARYGVTGPAVHFWETGGRVPASALIIRMAADGVCDAGDWYVDAESDSDVAEAAE